MTDLNVLKMFIAKDLRGLEEVICAPTPAMDAFTLAAWAVKDDEESVLRLALQHCDPLHSNSMLLRQAVEFGSNQCFNILLPISNPTDNKSEALQWAIYYDRVKMFNQLIKVCNIADAVDEIDSGYDGVLLQRAHMILDEQKAFAQAHRIENELENISTSRPTKKI